MKIHLTDEQIDQWVADLRSGRFTKIIGTFKKDDMEGGRCALGVLREQQLTPEQVEQFRSAFWYPCLTELLPGAFWEYVVDLNDRKGASFNEIADVIESNRDVILGREEMINAR